jgi:hypothetical protein
MSNLNENILKIKNLIKFDRSKTIIENRELITESEDDDIRNYFYSYLDKKKCLEIREDLRKYVNSVNSGNPKISDNDKARINQTLIEFDSYPNWKIVAGCEIKVKPMMKDSFNAELANNKESVKSQICWFSKNIHIQSLSFCNAQPQQTNNNTQTTIQTQNTQNTIQTQSTNNNSQITPPTPTPTPTPIPRKTELNPSIVSPVRVSSRVGI